MDKNGTLKHQYKTKSGLTQEQEKRIGLDKPLTDYEQKRADANRARIEELRKEKEKNWLVKWWEKNEARRKGDVGKFTES